jgi:hypothetical protein
MKRAMANAGSKMPRELNQRDRNDLLHLMIQMLLLEGGTAAMGGGDGTEEFCTCVSSLVSQAVQRGNVHLPEVRQTLARVAEERHVHLNTARKGTPKAQGVAESVAVEAASDASISLCLQFYKFTSTRTPFACCGRYHQR